jgi:copper chaperone
MTKNIYKTNINCNSCLNTVSPFLNDLEQIDTWRVDLEHPDRLLHVALDNDDSGSVVSAVKSAGFEIEKA